MKSAEALLKRTGPEKSYEIKAFRIVTLLTEMTRKEGFAPGFDFRDPSIESQNSRNASESKDGDEKNNQAPGIDTEGGVVKQPKGEPCTDVYEASTVEHKVDYRGEYLAFGPVIEVTIP